MSALVIPAPPTCARCGKPFAAKAAFVATLDPASVCWFKLRGHCGYTPTPPATGAEPPTTPSDRTD